jgi:hypothetical protein
VAAPASAATPKKKRRSPKNGHEGAFCARGLSHLGDCACKIMFKTERGRPPPNVFCLFCLARLHICRRRWAEAVGRACRATSKQQ